MTSARWGRVGQMTSPSAAITSALRGAPVARVRIRPVESSTSTVGVRVTSRLPDEVQVRLGVDLDVDHAGHHRGDITEHHARGPARRAEGRRELQQGGLLAQGLAQVGRTQDVGGWDHRVVDDLDGVSVHDQRLGVVRVAPTTPAPPPATVAVAGHRALTPRSASGHRCACARARTGWQQPARRGARRRRSWPVQHLRARWGFPSCRILVPPGERPRRDGSESAHEQAAADDGLAGPVRGRPAGPGPARPPRPRPAGRGQRPAQRPEVRRAADRRSPGPRPHPGPDPADPPDRASTARSS